VNTEDLAFLREHVSTIDGQRAERLEEVRGRIHAARRRRMAGRAAGASLVMLVAVAGVVLAVTGLGRNDHTHPIPAGPPTTSATALPRPDFFGRRPATWTSALLRYRISYPNLWRVTPAHVARTYGTTVYSLRNAAYDVYRRPPLANHVRVPALVVTSQPVPAGTSALQWLRTLYAEPHAHAEDQYLHACFGPPFHTTLVDGHTVYLSHGSVFECDETQAVTVAHGRGYLFLRYKSPLEFVPRFGSLLATVKFLPGPGSIPSP
jgi:hypothetical protein